MTGTSGLPTSNRANRRFLSLGRRLIYVEAMMIKVARIALLSSALIGGTAGVASAQWYPPVLDPHGTYRIPGTEDFMTGRGNVEGTYYTDVHKFTPPAATQNAPRPAAVQRTAPLSR
jgi:hypothetical protein